MDCIRWLAIHIVIAFHMVYSDSEGGGGLINVGLSANSISRAISRKNACANKSQFLFEMCNRLKALTQIARFQSEPSLQK